MFTMTRYTDENCRHVAAVMALAASLLLALPVFGSAHAAPYDYSADPCWGLQLQGMHTQSRCLVPFPYNNQE